MKNAIIIHGMEQSEELYRDPTGPSASNSHFIPWLQHQLLTKDILTQTPEMPHPYLPVYEEWKEVFEQFSITHDTILIGHSCGGGFLLRYLSEHHECTPQKVILVAPWIDPVEPKELPTGFFDFDIDTTLTSRTKVVIYYSTDDEAVCVQSAEIIMRALPDAELHTFADKGHFTQEDLGTAEFPELLQEVLE